MDSLALPRTVLRLDIVGSGRFGFDDRNLLDQRLVSVVDAALDAGLRRSFPDAAHVREDGDSLTVVLGPTVPKACVLADFVLHELPIALHDDNRRRDAARRLRVRGALDHGETAIDGRHFNGVPVLTTARLIEAPPLREAVRRALDRDLGLIVSDRFYRDVVTNGERGLGRIGFDQVEAQVKDFREIGWLHAPGTIPRQRGSWETAGEVAR